MKRLSNRIVLASVLALALPSVAAAQKKPAAKPASAATETAAPNAAPRVKNYDFDADVIDGELVKPEGDWLAPRKFAEHGSLIRIRADFVREIVKSAEDM
jgi:hypothetical protein